MSPEHVRLLLESMGEAVVAVDEQGRTVYFNEAAQRLLGKGPAGIAPEDWPAHYRLYRADGRTPLLPDELPFVRALRGEATREQVILLRRKADGEGQFLGATGAPLHGPDGAIQGGVVVLRDISERFQSTERLRRENREREEFLHQILDHLAHPVFVKDRSFRWVFLNRAHDEMVGIPREEMLGKSDYDFFPKSQADFFRQKDIELFTRGEQVAIDEEPITDAKGTTHILSTTKVPLVNEQGEVTHLVGIIHDITRLKRAEEQARQLAVETAARESAEESHRRVALLADVSRVLARSIDVESALPRVAQLPLGILGDWCVIALSNIDGALRTEAVAHTDEELSETAWAMLQRRPVSPEAEGGLAEVARTGRPRFVQSRGASLLEIVRGEQGPRDERDPRFSVHSCFCLPLQTRERRLGAIVFGTSPACPALVAEDVALAEEVALRIALALEQTVLYREAQEAIRVRDEFLQIASHELRTPITSLKMQLQHAMRLRRVVPEGLGDDRIVRAFKLMVRQVDRLSSLVENLLDVSALSGRGLAFERERVDLVELVREVLEQVGEEGRRAGCRVRLDAEAPVIGDWDPMRLRQVVTNLLTNAFKFGRGRPIELSVGSDGETARLSVTDHGIGISGKDTERIFGQFERAVSARHFGGLGLGLFISRRIVEAHGGEIQVSSSEGKGTTFTVLLPLRAAEEPALGSGLGSQEPVLH